jgi:alpha-D-ribose 1-methylphosphonate 5-triphosphate synthase subunit PhnG
MARKRRLEALAVCDADWLRDRMAALGERPAARPLKGPEMGMVMLRGRIGGGGAQFNLGEATVSRATIRLDSGAVGHAVVLGRAPEKALAIAEIDALAQSPDWAARIEAELVGPALEHAAAAHRKQAEEVQATRVNFFTMVRGENQ